MRISKFLMYHQCCRATAMCVKTLCIEKKKFKTSGNHPEWNLITLVYLFISLIWEGFSELVGLSLCFIVFINYFLHKVKIFLIQFVKLVNVNANIAKCLSVYIYTYFQVLRYPIFLSGSSVTSQIIIICVIKF